MAEIRYVVGFIFNPTCREVVLIRKRRPTWQRGKLNGIGGHVEAKESAERAMQRECREETGLNIQPGWQLYCELKYPGVCRVSCFRYIGPLWAQTYQMTDEYIERWSLAEALANPLLVPNCRWLIPLAVDPQIEDVVEVNATLPAEGVIKEATG